MASGFHLSERDNDEETHQKKKEDKKGGRVKEKECGRYMTMPRSRSECPGSVSQTTMPGPALA
jgi:hypothetical protein